MSSNGGRTSASDPQDQTRFPYSTAEYNKKSKADMNDDRNILLAELEAAQGALLLASYNDLLMHFQMRS
jgi:hypothetical protein